jgi:methionyl aminopeptidase
VTLVLPIINNIKIIKYLLCASSRDCFKSSWNDHKGIHKQVNDARSDEAKLNPTSIPSEFRGYTFTGSLRPCQQSPRRAVPDSTPKPDYTG